jgi:hypothetical protein
MTLWLQQSGETALKDLQDRSFPTHYSIRLQLFHLQKISRVVTRLCDDYCEHVLQTFPPIICKCDKIDASTFHLPSSIGSCGAGNLSHVGSTPHISHAYSAIVLSLENLLDEAMLWIHIFIQTLWSCIANHTKYISSFLFRKLLCCVCLPCRPR